MNINIVTNWPPNKFSDLILVSEIWNGDEGKGEEVDDKKIN